MNSAQIEKNLQKLIRSFKKETFIYEVLLPYGMPKASITRLQKGNLDLSKVEGEISWKKKLLFKEEYTQDLHITVTEAAKEVKHNERFVIVTDYKLLLAIDTKTDDKLDIDLKDLPKHYDFFLPWAGMEKALHANENPADVKAAEKMDKLFDEIKNDNPDDSPEFIHGLNVFLSRLLFCFFAEDTEIFKDNQFTNAFSAHTQADGSDVNAYLDKLFEVLNTANKDRKKLPAYLNEFPYVNGGLFEKKLKTPKFTRRSRQAIIDSGTLNWSAINPDIFGSMIQAVITPEHRGGLGMHYTSVPNIMKVIEPLFLNDLYENFEKAEGNPKKLNELLHRLSKLKIFDPACGSGNFLIIAYKELRRLEIKIIQHLNAMQKAADGFKRNNEPILLFEIPKAQLELAASYQVELFSRISLNQFYGIELDDFAHEIAQLSLWLAEHQMNVEFKKEFGQTKPTLPLKEAGKIVHGNACRIDWEEVCPKKKGDETFILGNPPYLGSKRQDIKQKHDLKNTFRGIKGYKNLDYIANWFYLGSEYIENSNCKMSFVTTNSITQGDQVALLWPHIFTKSLQIQFAHSTFKWGNNAKGGAGVSCVIIGIGAIMNSLKTIFAETHKIECDIISPYLTPNSDVIVSKRTKLLSHLPEMCYGNMPLEGGFLKLNPDEKNQLLRKHPEASRFIRPLIGGEEFLNGHDRFALWIEDSEIDIAKAIAEIDERINGVFNFRVDGGDVARSLISKSYQFRYRKEANDSFILIPCTSSEKREYLQCGFYDKNFITLNSAQIIYDAPPFVFGVISSRMHMLWSKATAGTLESRLRYSTQLCYNTFPLLTLSDQRKSEITQCVFRILEEREKYSEKTLAQLYDPDKMPEGLREAHRANDMVIEKCYRARPFESDEERLEYLFKLYVKMIEEEKNTGGLFEEQKKTKGKTSKKKKHA